MESAGNLTVANATVPGVSSVTSAPAGADDPVVAAETPAPAHPIARILIIVENLPVPFDTRVWQEANTLTRAGYKVSIICPAGRGYEKSKNWRPEIINGISIYRHKQPLEGKGALGYLLEYSSSLFREFLFTWIVLFREGFDAIHACNPPDDIFLIGALFKLFGKKYVFDHHDINPELYMAKFGKKNFFYKLMCMMEKLTFRTADISLATNESYRQIALKRGGMDPGKVFVVRSGPDPDRMRVQPPKEEIKQGRKFMVGYVGVIGKQEGMEYLLEAADYICNKKGRKDVFFGVVGGGPGLDEAKRNSEKMGLKDFVEFTGRVNDSKMLDYLNTSDICVNPDEFNEMNDKSTMNKILEYMALGKPIVQFDMTEGRFSAQAASLYAKRNDSEDFAEKIIYLLDNDEIRQKMGEYGRKRIERELNWTVTGESLVVAYDRLFRFKRNTNM